MVSAWNAAVAVDVNRVHVAVMIEAGDGENESEDQNDSADDSGQQEHLFDAVVRSKPLSHGRSPRRMFCLVVPAVGTIARNSRSQ